MFNERSVPYGSIVAGSKTIRGRLKFVNPLSYAAGAGLPVAARSEASYLRMSSEVPPMVDTQRFPALSN
jgi:hypothetical protein